MMDTNQLRQLTGTAELDKPLITASEFSVESHKSSRPVWMKPLPKFAMVMILLLPVVALAGTFLTGGGHSEQAQTALGHPAQQTPQSPQHPEDSPENLQQEVARLKAKSALDGQAKIEKQLAKQPNSKPVKTVGNTSPKPAKIAQAVSPGKSTSAVTIQSQPPKIATASVSRPETIPIRESRLVSRSSTSYPVPTRVNSPSRPEIETTPELIVDPQERWQQLVRLGSYGSVRPESEPLPESIAAETPTNQAKLTTWEKPDVSIEPLPPEPQPASLIAGSNAAAVFEMPLVLDDSQSNERFTIVLSEPIADAAGNTALPVNTKLMVQVDDISQTGRVQLSALSATWEQNGQTKEMSLPAGAIQIRGNQGQPLIAQQFEDKGKELASLDTGQFILSAVRGASSQLIQPNTRVQTGNGSTVITQENQRPNILAGAIQGGADNLLNTISERNKRAADEIQQRPPIRYIAAGTTVQVFINQSIQLPL